jgi:hypothetical protein
MCVPKATVDEDRQSELFQNEVRSAGKMIELSGKSESQGPKHALAFLLCGRACRMHGTHDPATFLLCEGINHGIS